MKNQELLENLRSRVLVHDSDIKYSDIRDTTCSDCIPYNWKFSLDEIKKLIDSGKERELYHFNSIKNAKHINVLVKKLVLDKFQTLQKFEEFLEKCYAVDINPLPYLREWLPEVNFKFYYIQHSSWIPYCDNLVAIGYNQDFNSVSVCVHTELLDDDDDDDEDKESISKSSIPEDPFTTDVLKDDLESTTNTKQKKRRIVRKKTEV